MYGGDLNHCNPRAKQNGQVVLVLYVWGSPISQLDPVGHDISCEAINTFAFRLTKNITLTKVELL